MKKLQKLLILGLTTLIPIIYQDYSFASSNENKDKISQIGRERYKLENGIKGDTIKLDLDYIGKRIIVKITRKKGSGLIFRGISHQITLEDKIDKSENFGDVDSINYEFRSNSQEDHTLSKISKTIKKPFGQKINSEEVEEVYELILDCAIKKTKLLSLEELKQINLFYEHNFQNGEENTFYFNHRNLKVKSSLDSLRKIDEGLKSFSKTIEGLR